MTELTIKNMTPDETGKRSIVLIDWDTERSVVQQLDNTDPEGVYEAMLYMMLQQLEGH